MGKLREANSLPETDLRQARRARRLFHWAAAALGLAAIAVAACSGADPSSTPSASATPTPTPTPRIIASLAAPSRVTASAADRRLAVSWSPVDGATGYKVAARLKNGVEPFDWSEYEADSPPYAIAERWAAMSGLEYEIRTASVNNDGQSVWSPPVAVTAPELRSASPDAVGIVSSPPYRAGDLMQVHLTIQRTFTNRSLWVWSVCDSDGQGCKLLPLIEKRSYDALVPSAARGKRMQVQVDYDKDGLSYTATAVVGVVGLEDGWGPTLPSPALPPGCDGETLASGGGAFASVDALATVLHRIESRSVAVDWDDASGGAVEPLCNSALVVTPWGRIALARPNGAVDYLDGRVPMNLDGLTSHQDSETFHTDVFRVTDVLLRRHSEDLWEMFVTHHYFTGECNRFRLSSTTILWQAGTASVSPNWRTIFDADPCMPPQGVWGMHAGGKMLTDGPDHLLIVVGDHNYEWTSQNPESHMGKLVRVAIDSGEAEFLAFGLRNPQGFARDAEGNLWETEHGPLGGDELNILEPGSNYGWPSASYGIDYTRRVSLRVWETAGKHEGFVKPRFAWVPSIGISAVIVNDERWFPLWGDDLLVSSLAGTQGSGKALFRVRRDGADVRYVERIEVGYRMRDMTQMPDGRIAVLADGGNVHFLRLSAHCDEESRRQQLIYVIGCGPLGDGAAGAPDPNADP